MAVHVMAVHVMAVHVMAILYTPFLAFFVHFPGYFQGPGKDPCAGTFTLSHSITVTVPDFIKVTLFISS